MNGSAGPVCSGWVEGLATDRVQVPWHGVQGDFLHWVASSGESGVEGDYLFFSGAQSLQVVRGRGRGLLRGNVAAVLPAVKTRARFNPSLSERDK